MADGGEPDEEAGGAAAVLAPGDEVLVTVDSALPDILVVSYRTAAKSFQGALLDATKRGLPCGIQPPEPVKGPDGDKLATVAARFSYFQEKRYNTLTKAEQRRVHPPARSKNTRPTVRLRPRQVLCSKCRSICNENSENVGRKRKLEDASSTPEQPIRRSDRRCSSTQQSQNPPPHQHAQNTRSQRLLAAATNDNQSDESSSSKTTTSSRQSEVSTRSAAKLGATLIPKISRLRPAEIGSAMQSSNSLKSSIQLAEQVRSAYWKGRDEEDLAEAAQEEVENRPMNALAAEPMELDSNPTQAYCATPRRLSSSSVESAKVPPDEEDKKTLAAADSTVKTGRAARVQRKKHSIGLMEDLWDESVFEDTARTPTTTTSTSSNTATPPTTARATPVIKISFGAQGEGTVLKIPSKIQHPYPGRDVDTDTEEGQTELDHDPLEMLRNGYDGYNGHCDIGTNGHLDAQRGLDAQALLSKECETASSKAAKKALKKAKKKALRKMFEAASPARSPCNGSPRYNVNFEKMSQLYHRRKHKMKHKKKHKEERKHKSSSSSSNNTQQLDCLVGTNGDAMMMDMVAAAAAPRTELTDHEEHEAYTAIKEQCLKQKLSISLKRLNTNAYAPSYPVSNASSGCKSPEASSDDEEEEHEEETNGETAPDFPPPEHPLVMRLSAAATPVEGCLSAAGRRMDVGDVVWGKVHGFPWWPGKVLSITDSCKEDGTAEPQAHVAWYGSSTSSLMSCDQLSPFLETFKVIIDILFVPPRNVSPIKDFKERRESDKLLAKTRYNKKKKGPYKEAIRQAQSEARSQIAPNSTSSVLDVCSSPREVNVLS